MAPPMTVVERDQAVLHTVRTLVVDDSGEARLILLHHLRRLGVQLLESACDGIEAMEKFRSWRPQIVFLDGIMPRQGGLETLQEIKRSQPETVVVMCTSLSDLDLAREFRRVGADAYLLKPYDRPTLEGILGRALVRVTLSEGAAA